MSIRNYLYTSTAHTLINQQRLDGGGEKALFIYLYFLVFLFQRITETESKDKRDFPSASSLPRWPRARAGLDQSQEPRISPRSPMWVVGAQILGLSSSASPRSLETWKPYPVSWTGSRAARTWARAQTVHQESRWGFSYSAAMSASGGHLLEWLLPCLGYIYLTLECFGSVATSAPNWSFLPTWTQGNSRWWLK